MHLARERLAPLGAQVSLKGAVMPAGLSVNPPKELQLKAIFNGGVLHPGQGGHVVTAELLITLAMVGGACVLAVRGVCVLEGRCTSAWGHTWCWRSCLSH